MVPAEGDLSSGSSSCSRPFPHAYHAASPRSRPLSNPSHRPHLLPPALRLARGRAGISSDWPYGRGCYMSADKGFNIWVGEEDHLRIMCMQKGVLLNKVRTGAGAEQQGARGREKIGARARVGTEGESERESLGLDFPPPVAVSEIQAGPMRQGQRNDGRHSPLACRPARRPAALT